MATSSVDVACTYTPYQLSSSQLEIYKLTLKGLVEFAMVYCAKKENLYNRFHVTEDCMIALKDVAKSAFCKYPWCVLKVVLTARLQEVCHTLYEHSREYSVHCIDGYTFMNTLESLTFGLLQLLYPPVTLQRLCEVLISSPYRNIEKLMACLRKLVTVRTPHYEMICMPEGIDWQHYPELSTIEEKIITIIETDYDLEWMEMDNELQHRSRSASSSGTFVEAEVENSIMGRKRKQLTEMEPCSPPAEMMENGGKESRLLFSHSPEEKTSFFLGLKRPCSSTTPSLKDSSSANMLPEYEINRNNTIDAQQAEKQQPFAGSVRILAATRNDQTSTFASNVTSVDTAYLYPLDSHENVSTGNESGTLSCTSESTTAQAILDYNNSAIPPNPPSSFPTASTGSDLQCSS